MWNALLVIKSYCTFAYRGSPGTANAPVLSNKCWISGCTAIIQNERDYWIQDCCPLGLSLSRCIALYFLSKWISSPRCYCWVLFKLLSPSCTELEKTAFDFQTAHSLLKWSFLNDYYYLSICLSVLKEQYLKCMDGLLWEGREREISV